MLLLELLLLLLELLLLLLLLLAMVPLRATGVGDDMISYWEPFPKIIFSDSPSSTLRCSPEKVHGSKGKVGVERGSLERRAS